MDGRAKIFTWRNARIILIVLFLGGVAAEALYGLQSPAIPLLPPTRDGEWLRPNLPASLGAISGDLDTVVFYRKRFTVSEPSGDIVADVTAFRNAEIFLDGNQVSVPFPSSWKDRIRFTLPSRLLGKGPHELMLRVRNRLGPALFQLTSNIPRLGDADGWECSPDGMVWIPATRCDDLMVVETRSMFPTTREGIQRSLRLLIPLTVGILILAAFKPRPLISLAAPGRLKILLLAFWLILGINNMFKLPLYVGFDAKDHWDYISYLLENHRIPVSSEGWQMFQPPLYHVVSAALYWILSQFAPPETSMFLLRIIPLACALLLVDLSARILRELFPEREDLQSCGLVVGGLLPMNLYMCQSLGNEPLTAVLTALLLYLSVRIFRKSDPVRWTDAALLGVVGGLAMLTKVTPVLLIPIICLFLLLIPRGDALTVGSRARMAGLFLLTVVAVSGWFYARNWILFGKPFLGGWDPLRNVLWWQDPGYRTVADFLTFGEALKQPVYAAFNGFADGIYSSFWSDSYLSGIDLFSARPKWNYVLLATGVALSLVPASAMGAGVALAFWRAVKQEELPHTFLFVAMFVYLAALLHLYVSLPIYSTAKASYLMGLTPVFGVMSARGAGLLVRRKYVGAIFASLLATWGVVTYLTYFVL